MIINSAGKTDIGLVRKSNEDSIKLLPNHKLYIVCDGMGGHAAGEVASSSACETIGALYGKHFDGILSDEKISLPRVFPPSTDVLTKAVRIANHDIFRRSAANPSLSGMGTTIVAVAVEQDILTVLHVGDSRIYRYFNKTLTPLTVDHSWAAELEQSEKISAEEAKNLVNRNVITRALGVKDSVDIDVAVRKIVDGDIYILCSDGLCGFVEDTEIREVVKQCDNDVDKISVELVKMANDRGGLDNVSVVAIKVVGKPESSELQELDTVTVDGEPSEYYPLEESWADSAAATAVDDTETGDDSGGGYGKYLAFAVIVVVFIAVFYLIYKG